MKFKLLFALLISTLGFSQIWVNSLDDAKKMAKATNKLILIDFNADWCKPCKQMESEFWYNKEFKKTLDKFIVVPINIDSKKDIAAFYRVNSIPDVKLVDINGEVIHEVLGFDSGSSTNTEFEGFPDNVGPLYEDLEFKDKKSPTDVELLTLASTYQILLQKSKGYAKRDFFRFSNSFFNKAFKKTQNPNYKELSELGKSFNSVLTDVNKKVIKELDASKISTENKAYAYYILAKANYQENNKEEAKKCIIEIEKLNNEEWLNAAKVLKTKYGD